MVSLVTRTIGVHWPNPDPPSFLDGNLNDARKRFSLDYDTSWHINIIPSCNNTFMKMLKIFPWINLKLIIGASVKILALEGSWELWIWPEKYWISASPGSITFHNERSRIMPVVVDREGLFTNYYHWLKSPCVFLPRVRNENLVYEHNPKLFWQRNLLLVITKTPPSHSNHQWYWWR